MIVEDDFSTTMNLEEMLTALDHKVVGKAERASKAIDMARELKPDLIFMDIVMPGDMDGITAAEKIKEEWGIPIVFLTAYGNPEYIQRAKRAEPFGYILKPFEESEIQAVVEIALYKHEIDKKLKKSHAESAEFNRKLKKEIEEREKNELKYQSLFENSPIGIATLDEERNVLDFNDTILQIFGYARNDMENVGNTREYYYNTEDRAETDAELANNGFVKEKEVKFKRKDGTPFDALFSMQPIEIGGKSLWHAMVQDISDRKRFEDELRNSRREWEGIFQSIGQPTMILNADHVIAHANKATEKATGRPEKDLIGMKCYQIFHDAGGPPKGCPFERMATSRHLESVEMEIEALEGSFLVSCTPMLDEKGRIEKVIHIATDITQLKQTEQALRESEEKYRDLVENINDVIYALDSTGTVTYVSPTIEAISGYSPSEIIGKHMTGFVHRDDHASLAERFRELIMEGHIQAYEYRMIDKQGKIRWVRSSSRLIFQDGKFSGVQGVFTEITHSKKLEEQLRHAQKMEAISTLTGGIAHDYNNLLTIILGNLSMARDLTKPHSFMAELLDQVEQASSKAGDLTHRLMTLSTGGHPMKIGGSVRSLLKEIIREVKSPDGIKYVFSIQDDLWLVEYDSKQMHYAISNLLINAMEAMPRGGEITIKAENKVIDDRDKESRAPLNKGKYVEISISDQGKGIPEKHLSRIYDPYFSTKERGVQKGMGLGLTTAYAVVEKHGGHILVNSSTGAGTTVTIYLPAVEEEIPSTQRDHVETRTTIANQQSAIRRILVMDDEESLRNLTQAMLGRLGYKVETAKDGVEAISKYKEHLESGNPFDVVILDLTIKGGMGGDQTIKELIKIDPGVKAIVCSGYFNDPVMANYKEHGFRGVLAKPYQKQDIERLLKALS